MDASSSSKSTAPSSPLWDVFLSFYGKDTRKGFVSNLYHALDQAGIVTFRDEPALEKGEEIAPGLHHAISNSKMFVVVISENYAYSPWCLDELVEVLRCNTTKKQVIPVFYYVNPSDLRYQKGGFGEALKKHEARYSVTTIDKWKHALTGIAALSGYHLEKEAKENEAETIQKIVEDVLPRSSKKVLNLENYLLGIDPAVEEIYQRLSMESNDVRALGICGMGGIGKTTTAEAFYNKYSNKFDVSCFIKNVKQYSHGDGPPIPLLEQLLIELLRVKDYKVLDVQSALRKLEEILSSKKALIVLDDLDELSYEKLLVKICKMFADGSRVIITTRDVNLPNKLKVNISQVDIYMVKQMEQEDSLELFSYHVFDEPMPAADYVDLSKGFVTYARGLPLALKVLGSSLRGRIDVSFWRAKLEKIRKTPVEGIQKILQLSYDELDEKQKAIFLDIVFFFVGKNRDEAGHVLESCDDFFPDEGIPILVERCLLTIDEDNNLQMHDLIQDMGRKVIREESKHRKSRYLYLNHEEACQALHNPEGMDKIEGLILDFRPSTTKYCNAKIFEKLPKLRLLKLIDVHNIKGNFKSSFHELRYISWRGCPWTYLPSMFHFEKLATFDMPLSKFKALKRDGYVPFSAFLRIFGDVKLPSLRHLNLEGCKYLEELPESIGQMTKLDHLIVCDCENLKGLPKPIVQLTFLSRLNLRGCRNLKVLPDQLGDMKGLQMLDASFTAIEQLPDSIVHLKKLFDLKLRGCWKLRKLPEQFGNMESLKKFDASGSQIEQLPDSFSNLLNLVDLYLDCCTNLTSLPNSIWKLKSLQILDLHFCFNLNRLPEQLGKMQCLKELKAYDTAIEKLPDSIGELPRIQVLDFHGCEKLTYVPNSIYYITSIRRLSLCHNDSRRIELPDAVNNTELMHLYVSGNARAWTPVIQKSLSLKVLHLDDSCGSLSPTTRLSLSNLVNLEELKLGNFTGFGPSLPELPLNLQSLEVSAHHSLVKFPDLSHQKQLKRLLIKQCSSLQSLHKLSPHLSELAIQECQSLQDDLPDLSMLGDLARLELTHHNGGTLKVNLMEINLQVTQDDCDTFQDNLRNSEIPEWFNYKHDIIEGSISFDIPTILENSAGFAFGVAFKTPYLVRLFFTPYMGKVYVKCTSGDDVTINSGDKIDVSFRVFTPDRKVSVWIMRREGLISFSFRVMDYITFIGQIIDRMSSHEGAASEQASSSYQTMPSL